MDRLSPTLLVFIGAGLGGVVRHALNNAVPKVFGADYPWATPIINITGSVLMGLLVGWLAFRASGGWGQHLRLFAATGILGGYTTFSTFSLETVLLIERARLCRGLCVCLRLGAVRRARPLVGDDDDAGSWMSGARSRPSPSADDEGGDAARSLVPPPLSELAAIPSQPQRAQGRGPRRGQARRNFDPARSRAEGARAADDRAAPEKAAPAVNPADADYLRELILFEDRDVVVFNKPWGLASQGGSGTKRHVDGMLASLADRNGERPVLVHRLDRDTSGVLLCAKSRKMAADLGALFRARETRKIYWALVEGCPKPENGRISLFLAKGEAMGRARRQERRSRRSRAHARRPPRRPRGATFGHALRHG